MVVKCGSYNITTCIQEKRKRKEIKIKKKTEE